MYYVRRNNKVSGPFENGALAHAYDNGQLRKTDFVANSPDGPWISIARVIGLIRHGRSLPKSVDLPVGKKSSEGSIAESGRSNIYSDKQASSTIKRKRQSHIKSAHQRNDRKQQAMVSDTFMYVTGIGLMLTCGIAIVSLAVWIMANGNSPATPARLFFDHLGNGRLSQAKRYATGDIERMIDDTQALIRENVNEFGVEGRMRGVNEMLGKVSATTISQSNDQANVEVVYSDSRYGHVKLRVGMRLIGRAWKVSKISMDEFENFRQTAMF